jgi:four helix bundle protein
MFKFETLTVWQKSITILDILDQVLDKVHRKDQFSLGEQLRRASLSISANIAEGSGRKTRKEENYFFSIARGSTYETVSLLFVAFRRKYIGEQEFRFLYNGLEEISKMLIGLMNR